MTASVRFAVRCPRVRTVCEDNGVKEEAVTAFDVAHPNAEEPGELKDAPYHWEHFTAETIERQLAIALRRDWRD